jgi:cation diffusion facilitator CzcD-associated flavoprotein CzcO
MGTLYNTTTNSYLSELLFDFIFRAPFILFYMVFQSLLDRLLSPTPPPPNAALGRPKIAIIGAGLTGVSSASHCVGHGFDVTIFEAGNREALGGIWAKVNNTSGLQIHSVMYRFHPSLNWSNGYPNRKQIVSQITQLWNRYGLEDKTMFDTRVEKVYKDPQGRWIINNESNGRYDGVIACIGTCGDPKSPKISGQENFKGPIIHSSKLDGVDAKGKKVLVIGGGASAIEALEFVEEQESEKTYILARSEKWLIPRNVRISVHLQRKEFR